MRKFAEGLLFAAFFLSLGMGIAWGVRAVLPAGSPFTVETGGMSVPELLDAGDAAYADMEYSKALTYYEKAAQLAPGDAAIRLRIGRLYQLKNRYADAEQELLFADELQPDNPEVLYRLGKITRDTHRFDEATAYLARLVELAADDPAAQSQARFVLGEVRIWEGDWDAARANFEYVVQQDDARSDAWLYLGLLELNRDIGVAAAHLQKVMALEPGTLLGEKAKAALDQVNGLGALADAYARDLEIGRILVGQNLPTLAYDYVKRVADQQPEYQQAQQYMGYVHYLLGDTMQAEEKLLDAQSLGSGPTALGYFYLGETYFARGKWPQAVEAYERAVDAGDRNKETYYHLGLALRQTGDVTRAVKAHLKALDVDPNDLQVQTTLMNVLIADLKDLEQAETIARAGVDRQPQSARAWALLGWILAEREALDAAEDALQQALALDRGEASAYLNLAMVREQQDQTAEAIQLYQKALDVDTRGNVAPIADAALQELH